MACVDPVRFSDEIAVPLEEAHDFASLLLAWFEHAAITGGDPLRPGLCFLTEADHAMLRRGLTKLDAQLSALDAAASGPAGLDPR